MEYNPWCSHEGVLLRLTTIYHGILSLWSTLPCPTCTINRVGAVRVERNRLELDHATGAQRAVGSGDRDEVVECGMVLGSIGYRCLPVEGVPYDKHNSIIANEG